MKNIKDFKTYKQIDLPDWIKGLAFTISTLLVMAIIILFLVPWVQTSQGFGRVIALNPTQRSQNIHALVSGRINKWHVTDGSVVKEGDPIVEIVDNDPNLMDRLKMERDAAFQSYQASKTATETALINYKRQKDLFSQGLSSRLYFEKAKIDYQKYMASEAKAAADLAKVEVKLSRQERQQIKAPSDGIILRVMAGSQNVLVSEGDVIASFVPSSAKVAVELYIDGNDIPLITPGREVRLLFEGWPAIQFSGWPSLSYGSFEGIVSVISPAIHENGKFRIIVTEKDDVPWPKRTILRQGTQVQGWVLLNTVSIGYELWRQFNNFPPIMDEELYMELYPNGKKAKKKKDK